MAEQRVEIVADELIRRLDQTEDPQLASEYADALSRIVRQTKPWEYWGFRPAPRPAATVDWVKTPAIIAALNARLADSDFDVRSLVLKRMMREGAAPELSRLADWLREESDEVRVDGILEALETIDAKEIQPLLIESVGRPALPQASRLKALAALIDSGAEQIDSQLLALGSQLEDGPVLAAVLGEFGKRKELDADDLLLKKIESSQPSVRAEAIRALGRRRTIEAREHVAQLLSDASREVRLAASEAAGLIGASECASSLLQLAATTDGPVVNASLHSLRQLHDGRAIDSAVAALKKSESQLGAIRYLSDFAGPEFLDPVVSSATTNLATEYQRAVTKLITVWDERYPEAHSVLLQAMADVHGQSGEPLVWRITRFHSNDEAASFLERLTDPLNPPNLEDSNRVDIRLAKGTAAEVQLTTDGPAEDSGEWVAWSPVRVSEQTAIEVLSSAAGNLAVWLNGQQQYRRESPGEFQPDSDRVRLVLQSGMNVIAVKVQSDDKPPRFHLRFRRRSSKAKQERLAQFAIRSKGNAGRGRTVFESSQKTACINCHRMGEKGGNIGPDLSGIGRRFSRIHLVESILDPSRSVAPSYATIAVLTISGQVMTGVRISESVAELVIGDNQGKTHVIRKADIDEVTEQATSIMPEGLEEQLTDRQFADLLAFLESMKRGD
jgi:putative heme-binding domain-containing protein